MKTTASFIALLALSNLAFADVVDTATQREFFTPTGKCKISIPKSEFFITKEQIKPSGTTAYYALSNEKKMINYSFYIDTITTACDSNAKCLDIALSNKAYEKAKGLKRYEYAGYSVAEFNMEFSGKNGTSIIQKNILAESFKDGCWVDIHLSQVGLDSPDVNNILSILKEATIQR